MNWISKSKGLPKTGYYKDADDFLNLPQEKVLAICAFCYYDGKFVLVWNGSNIRKNWEPVAGHVEKDETFEEALIREIKEESNMKVLKFWPLGYLYVQEGDFYQAQYLCQVEPYGPFISDPDGGVTEIKLVDFAEIDGYLTKDDTSRSTLSRCAEVWEKLKLDKKL